TMKETRARKHSQIQITPPENFTHVTHVDRSDTVACLVDALQTPVRPIDGHGWPETVPLPRKATGPSLGRGSMPRSALSPSTFSSSAWNIAGSGTVSGGTVSGGTVSSAGYGTWNAGVKRQIAHRRSNLPNFAADLLVPKSRAPDVPTTPCSSPADGRFLSAPRHARSASASNDDVHALGRDTHYVNVKPFGQVYHDPHGHYKYAENDGYVKPYSVIKPQPPPHASPTSPKGRASTVHVHEQIAVTFRPPREEAPPPPRDSHHETDASTFIAAPNRITVELTRPTDLFGPGPGLGLGLGALGAGSIGIDDVVPLPCPGSLDSGVSEPPFPAPATAATEEAPAPSSISPEEVNDYLARLRVFYSDLKDSNQLDSEGVIHRLNVLKPAAEIILADLMDSRKKRPAPGPPVGNGASSGASPASADDAVTPTAARPVPKPRTTKPSASSPTGAAAGAADPATPTPAAAAAVLQDRFNALPEAAVQLDPTSLKLSPEHSQLARVMPSDDEDDDEECTRL
ncbi:hypothetical protein PENTCL1PPCAC_10171, partial [Pristionchus entomophagus]